MQCQAIAGKSRQKDLYRRHPCTRTAVVREAGGYFCKHHAQRAQVPPQVLPWWLRSVPA